MRITLAALAIALLAPVGVHAQRTSDYRDPDWNYEEGWGSLFNGKDLTGWVPVLATGEDTHRRYREGEHGEQSTFFVKDGKLMTTGTPNGYVRTADVYDNFVFHVEIRYTQQGNTGVLIHVQQDGVWPKGIECQGYQSHMGRIFPIVGATMEGGEMIHAAAKPTGEWNTYEVYSEEGRVATVLNGVIVGLGSNANPRIGHIALQSEGVPVEFRNIKMKRYTPAWPLRPR